MLFPVNNNYSERKLLLDIIKHLTPLEIELFSFIKENSNPIIDTDITKGNIEQCIILGAFSKLKMLGLINSNINSLSFGQSNMTSNQITISSLGLKFHKFCLEY
ncbi:MAG: hypothetical protein ACRC57_08205 [Sarcina sp.]